MGLQDRRGKSNAEGAARHGYGGAGNGRRLVCDSVDTAM